MTMFNALMGTIFLILVATSAAVTGSMIVLALFDRAFGKKSTPAIVADMESDQLKPPLELKTPDAGSKPRIKPLVAPGGGYRAKRKASPGYGPETQRVIPFG